MLHIIRDISSFPLAWKKVLTSIHLEKKSVIAKMKTLQPGATRILPTISMTHFMNGHGDIIGRKGLAG